MNDRTGGELRAADSHPKLRLTALVAVTAGVVVLAAAAFVFSYSGIHHIALAAGVSPVLARWYPVIFDVMLVIAFAAALALRGAGWWTRCYVSLSTLLLLAAVAAGNAVRAMGIALPRKPAAAAAAVIPWALLLLAFGFLLAMLRRLRRARAAAASAGEQAGLGAAANGGGHVAKLTLDTLLDPRPGTAAPSLGGRLPAAPPAARPALAGQPASPPPAPGPVAGPAADPVASLAADEDDLDSSPVTYENLPAHEHDEAGEDEDAGEVDEAGEDEEAGEDGTDDPSADYSEPEAAAGQPLSAPPPLLLDRPRSGPTPPS